MPHKDALRIFLRHPIHPPLCCPMTSFEVTDAKVGTLRHNHNKSFKSFTLWYHTWLCYCPALALGHWADLVALNKQQVSLSQTAVTAKRCSYTDSLKAALVPCLQVHWARCCTSSETQVHQKSLTPHSSISSVSGFTGFGRRNKAARLSVVLRTLKNTCFPLKLQFCNSSISPGIQATKG